MTVLSKFTEEEATPEPPRGGVMVPWAGAKSLKFPVVTRLGSDTVKGQHMAPKTTNRFNSAEAR